MTPVQAAFDESREKGDIAPIFPAFAKSAFFVLGAQTEPNRVEPLLGKSPHPNRLCVTISESKTALARAGAHPLIEMSGREVLEKFGSQHDVVVVYADGGDLLTVEQIEWFRRNS